MTVRTIPERLRIDCESTVSRLEQFITRQVHENGFARVVMGLSGGVDSGVVAALCTRALGPTHVKAYALPYRSSSAASYQPISTIDPTDLEGLPHIASMRRVAPMLFISSPAAVERW